LAFRYHWTWDSDLDYILVASCVTSSFSLCLLSLCSPCLAFR
jgi:hypothetical protein